MSDKSAIEWTQATLNPWTGCSKVSPGCARCYIPRTPPFRMAGRTFDEHGHIPLVFHMERLGRMLRRRKPTVYFVNSLSDLFHEDASDEQIARVFAAMAAAPQHTFQVLTKRPERMRDWMNKVAVCEHGWLTHSGENPTSYGGTGIVIPRGGRLGEGWPLSNIWLGVSIENRRFVHRADLLRQIPAAVRFVSAEPLLGPLISRTRCESYDYCYGDPNADDCICEAEGGDGTILGTEPWSLDLTGIDWLICGGESGKGARRMDLQWARDLRDACALAGTAFFVKQLGGPRPGTALEDLPEDLRIREFPRAGVAA